MKKITKLLSVFVIAGAMAGAGALAGCSHKHTYSGDWYNQDPNQHWHAATCEHTDEKADVADHDYDNDQDTTCNTCGYVRTVTPVNPGPENPTTKYSITYVINGHGTAPANVTEATALPATLPTLTAEGWTFGGWYTDNETFANAAVPGAALTANTTLYAMWTENEQPGPGPENPTTKYSITYVINGHGTAPANVAEATALPAELPVLTAEGWTFGGWFTDNETFANAAVPGAALTANATLYAKWTQNQQGEPATKYSITYVINGHGTQPTNETEATALPATLPVLTAEGWTFGGWYTDNETFANAAVPGEALTANATLYAKWTKAKEYDLVKTVVDFDAVALAKNPTASGNYAPPKGENLNYKNKVEFTSTGSSRFEVGSNCFNTQGESGTIIITLKGETNSLSIAGKGASGKFTGYKLTCNGTEVKSGKVDGQVDFSFELTDLPEGTYTLVTLGGAARIKKIELTEKLEKSEATGITVKALNVDFLKGEELGTNGLSVILNYANGRTDTLPATDYTVTSDYNKDATGKYTVTVTYKENEQFKDTYNVYVYSIDSIETNTIGLKNNAQVTLQQAVVTGGKLSTEYLTVRGTGTVEGRTHSFNLPASALDIQLPSTAAEGEITVNYSVNTSRTTGGKTLNGSYKVAVKNAVSAVKNKVEITVGETGDFKTLTQAVQFLKACNLADEVNKVIKLQAGTYTEKVWIDMSNVTLIGAGTSGENLTKITYSLVEGDSDYLSGGLWALYCATVHVTGNNFKAYNLSIHNDFNYIANAGNYSGNQAAQGVALTLEGDGNVIYKCHLYGNQDTLYMKKGRSYFYQTQVDGNVDFIFGGSTSIAFFEDCDIVAIDREKAENGHVAVPQHDASTQPKYGYVFSNCRFTDDGKVAVGGMTLGRPWGKKATVAYINCSFTAAYAWKFVDMSGNQPGDANFYVYGATDASGSPITGTPAGGKLLTEQQAEEYTIANTFGVNNTSSYGTAFDCVEAYSNLRKLAGLDEGEVTVDPIVNITFVFASQPAQSVGELYADKLTWSGTGKWNASGGSINSIQVSTDTVITMKVAGKVSVSWFSGQGTNDDILITYDAEGYATIKVVRASGKYMTGLTVDTNDKPAATQTVNVTVDYNYEGAPENATLTVALGSPMSKPSDPVRDGYKFTGWKVDGADYNFTANVTGAFTLVAQWVEVGPFDFTANESVDFTVEFANRSVNTGSTLVWRGITFTCIEADETNKTNPKFVWRAGNPDIQVNKGAKLSFEIAEDKTLDDITLAIVYYDGSKNLTEGTDYTVALEGNVVTITFIANTYIKSMSVTYNA